MATIGRRAYAEMFGPTVGDRVRLADAELVIEVEHDHTLKAGGYGDEVKFGGGKTIRDGMGQSQVVNGPGAHEAADCVITNALIVDHWGIVKADIGIKRSRIAAIVIWLAEEPELTNTLYLTPSHSDHSCSKATTFLDCVKIGSSC